MPFWARKDWADMTMHERAAMRERRQAAAAKKMRHAKMAGACEYKAVANSGELVVQMPVLVDAVHRMTLTSAAARDKRIRQACRQFTMYAFADRDIRHRYGNPGLITIARISPSRVESDSLRRITEPARDGIADVFAGQDEKGVWLGHYWDADQRAGACQWAYDQIQQPGVFGLRVTFTPRDT